MMNPRILQLAKQAGLDDDMFPLDEWDNPELEKFAELIVEECLDIVDGEDDGSADTKSVRLAMIRMKQHFGVAE
jgi:hypothetical protein